MVDVKEKKKVSSKVACQDQNHTLAPPTTFQRAYLGKLKLHSSTQILFFPPFLLRKTKPLFFIMFELASQSEVRTFCEEP